MSIFYSKIRCGDCGSFYGSKVWHSNDKYRKVIWRCNHKYDDGKNCSTPHLDEDTIKALYLKALRILGKERDEIIATFEAIKDEMYDTTELEAEQATLQQEVMVVTELVEQCISENAHVAQNQKYIGSRAPFGYIKDPNDRHHLIVDTEAAEIVKSIFKMFCDGIGYVRMTKILREKKVLNPQAYFNKNNPDYYKSDYWRQDFDWHATSIRAILNNPVYLGQTTFGRTKVKGRSKKKKVATDESE